MLGMDQAGQGSNTNWHTCGQGLGKSQAELNCSNAQEPDERQYGPGWAEAHGSTGKKKKKTNLGYGQACWGLFWIAPTKLPFPLVCIKTRPVAGRAMQGCSTQQFA